MPCDIELTNVWGTQIWNIDIEFVYCVCVCFENKEGSNVQASSRDYQSLTVERLRALLKAKGLSLKGKKASIDYLYLFNGVRSL